jgi:ABC-2 type transport system permease protein
MIATSVPAPIMARPVRASSLVRLKWRLWRNGFRRGGGQVAAMVLSIFFSLVLGIAARSATFADHRLGLTIAAAVVWVLAIIGPLVAGGIDESLPLTNLTPYPIPRRTLAVGLVTASMIGPVPLGVSVATLGAVIGASRSVVGAVLAAAAGAVLYVTLLVTARLLPTLFARAMNSRKGRDAAIALASLAGLSGIAMNAILGYFSGADGARLRSFGRVASWTPVGALGRAMVNGGRGHVGAATGGLAVGLVGFVALLAAYLWALARMEEQSPAIDKPQKVRVSGSPLCLALQAVQ